MGITAAFIYEMPVTGLHSETVWQLVECVDQIDDRFIDHIFAQAFESISLLILKIRILDEFFYFRVGFQLYRGSPLVLLLRIFLGELEQFLRVYFGKFLHFLQAPLDCSGPYSSLFNRSLRRIELVV